MKNVREHFHSSVYATCVLVLLVVWLRGFCPGYKRVQRSQIREPSSEWGTSTPFPYTLKVLNNGNAFFESNPLRGLAGFIMDRGTANVVFTNFRTSGADNFIMGIGAYVPGSNFQISNATVPMMTIDTSGNMGIGTTSQDPDSR
jgi:hypothetical protein